MWRFVASFISEQKPTLATEESFSAHQRNQCQVGVVFLSLSVCLAISFIDLSACVAGRNTPYHVISLSLSLSLSLRHCHPVVTNLSRNGFKILPVCFPFLSFIDEFVCEVWEINAVLMFSDVLLDAFFYLFKIFPMSGSIAAQKGWTILKKVKFYCPHEHLFTIFILGVISHVLLIGK